MLRFSTTGAGNMSDIQQITPDDSNWGMLAHLSALVGFIIPFGSILGPLLIWQIKGKESEYIATEAKEALNFQITMLIGFIICVVLMFVVIGIFLIWILAIADLVLLIMAAVSASKGQPYHYPFTLRLVK